MEAAGVLIIMGTIYAVYSTFYVSRTKDDGELLLNTLINMIELYIGYTITKSNLDNLAKIKSLLAQIG